MKKKKTRRLPYHPAFGYVTKEQWEQLQQLGLGPARDRLMEQVKRQNESNGWVE